MITCISGIPGSGKNVRATYLAKKHFKKENRLLKRAIRRIMHREVLINNVYTSYPVLLKHYSKWKKKDDIYSNRVTIFDLTPDNRFKSNALIIIDEAQMFYDSEEYKIFPKEIATFNQAHRHFNISDIIYITQHPSRLMKKLRVLCNEFDKVKTFIKIPFLPIGFMHIVEYYEFDDYGKYNHPKKEAKTYDVGNKYCLFITSKVFKSYVSTYLQVLNIDSPLYDRGTFNNQYLSKEEIKYIYRDKI